jgi:hypothetical protein
LKEINYEDTSRMSSNPPDTKKDIEAKKHPNTILFRGVFNRLSLSENNKTCVEKVS